MSVAIIPVDVLNPGQVFASLGLAEAIEVITHERCMSRFIGADANSPGHFEILVDVESPVRQVIDFLRTAKAEAVVQTNGPISLTATKWGIPSVPERAGISDVPTPRTPATLPVRLSDASGTAIVLDSWADDRAIGRDNVKFWAGAGGYPGAGLARDAIAIIAKIDERDADAVSCDPFAYSGAMSSSFRYDWRRDYVPLDVGFSPNEHGGMTMIGYPLVELLAAVGLENARPVRVKPRDKLRYRYATWSTHLPTRLARAALGNADLGFGRRTFQMKLDWPGQENQARCIVSAWEEL